MHLCDITTEKKFIRLNPSFNPCFIFQKSRIQLLLDEFRINKRTKKDSDFFFPSSKTIRQYRLLIFCFSDHGSKEKT